MRERTTTLRAGLRVHVMAAGALVTLWSVEAQAAQQPATVAEWQQAFAAIVEARQGGRLDDAERLARAALAAAQQAGADADALAFAHMQFGLTLQARRQFDAAEVQLRSAVEVTARTRGADAADVLVPIVNLANLELARGRFEAAEPLYRSALEISDAGSAPPTPRPSTSSTTSP